MKKNNLKYFFKMIVKTCLLILPLFAVAFSAFAPQRETKDINVNHKFNTNEVNSVNDLVEGNIYQFLMYDYIINIGSDNIPTIYCDIHYSNQSSQCYEHFGSLEDDVFYLAGYDDYNMYEIVDGDFELYGTFDNALVFIVYEGYPSLPQYFTKCPNEYIPIESVEVVTSNPSMETELIDFSNQFLNIPINQWYKHLINAVGLTLPTNLMLIVFVYPLYILWVEVFDVVLHCFLMFTNLCHKLLGEKD